MGQAIYLDEEVNIIGTRVIKRHILDVLLTLVFLLGCLTGGLLTSAFVLFNLY